MQNSSPLQSANHIPAIDRQDERIKAFVLSVMERLDYEPNEEQLLALISLGHFVLYSPGDAVYVLGGYAGTGKTSLMGAAMHTLEQRRYKVVLLAPTGRAAHVFSEYARMPAFTIHRMIYRQDSYGGERFSLRENKLSDTLFVVDEASMISNLSAGSPFGSGHLLDDLITFVYGGNNCRLLLMGDAAQLPPVGCGSSPALESDTLMGYGLSVYSMQLREIARQASESGILCNATLLRRAMEDGELGRPQFDFEGFGDFAPLTSEFLLETLSDCYDRDGMSETIVITRSNRRAGRFNMAVRNQVLYREELLQSDDLLIVSKNNYFWAEEYDDVDFIANGDVCRVKRVWGDVEQLYGFSFANVTVTLPDHNNAEMDVKILLDCLTSDTPALSPEQEARLLGEVMAELSGNKRERYMALKQHPYFNALQVKFGYAVTCHKAQGGQWKNVFIDAAAIAPEAMETMDFYRWLYTAITRASERAYLINWRNSEEEDF